MALVIAVVAAATSCAKKDDRQISQESEASSSLTMLLNESATLLGNPKVYNFKIQTSTGAVIERGGDLPAPGSMLTIHNLPVDAAATVSADLYTLNIEPRFQTHSCAATDVVKLDPGATTSIALDCIPVVAAAGVDVVKVFLKVAKAAITMTEADLNAAIRQRDLDAPMLLSHKDSRGRRITIRQTNHGLAFNLGGDIGYYAARTDATKSVLNQLVAGEEIQMTATAGALLQSVPEPAVLKISGAPMLYEAEDGALRIALPFNLNNTANTAGFSGMLFEEGGASEFTVVSYNVENLFDQTDDARNAHYGDYRIAPNDQGKGSNWGSLVDYNGTMMNFTQIKIEGVRKVLQAIDPAGPEVVGLLEVESKAAVEMVLERMKDLGYVSAQFTEFQAGVVPNAIGVGLISKFPVKATENIYMAPPAPDAEPARPILKVTLDVNGHDLVVYVNHWKSKGGPESQRLVSAQALEADVRAMLDVNPRADYIILGDLNSNYNETVTIEDRHNDTNNQTGINTVLNAQGNELDARDLKVPYIKYNLHYELDRAARRSAWHAGFGWSSLDHMIIGAGLYDQVGITYVDNSFEIAASHMDRYKFLFNDDGTTRRWIQVRESPTFTRHEVGGFADHLPLSARFRIAPVQDSWTIPLYMPGKSDKTDAVAAP
jgi:endonuclease/exonuclease/phosphatase family metal-dependent hydrolase